MSTDCFKDIFIEARAKAGASRRLVEPPAPLSIHTHGPGAPARAALEAFVHTKFQQSYGADIRTFYPYLIGITQPDGAIAAVAGVRSATGADLFAECYLDAPAEQLIASHLGTPIARNAVVEVGNLTPAGVGQARWLITALTSWLHAAGFSWVVFTAVPRLFNAFARMGLPVAAIAPARAERLGPDPQDRWGTYYDANPRVCVGDILSGHAMLTSVLGPTTPRLYQLWQDAANAGAEASKVLALPPAPPQTTL